MNHMQSYLVDEKWPELRLYVWKGAGQLASIHFKSLQWLTYVKSTEIPFKVTFTWEKVLSPHSLPYLECGTKRITDFVSLIRLCQAYRQYHNRDSGDFEDRSFEVSVNTVSLIALLDCQIQPALTYLWFGNDNNFEQVIRPLFARACPFPFGNWTPARLRRRHNEILDLIYPNRLADQWFEFRITELCEQCFHTLSTKLGDDTFFGGNQINADDALLFGYLAPMLYVTLPPGTRMVHALRQHPSLVALVERVRIHLYADLSSDMNGFKSSGLDSYELPDSVSWSELIFGAVIALSSMAAYAVWTGIVQFESDEDDVETESHSNAPSDNSSVESSDQKRPNPLFDLSQELLLPTPDSSDQQGDKSSRQERDSNEHQMPKLEEDTSSTN